MTLIWSLLRGSPLAKIIEALVTAALLVTAGFAWGEHVATSSAVNAVADQDARSQAAQGRALIEAAKAQQAAVNTAAEKSRSADDAVHAALTRAAADAEKSRAAALAALAQERQRNAEMAVHMDAMEHAAPVAQMFDPNDPRCGWGPDVRLRLDEATGAVAVIGSASAPAAPDAASGIADAAAAASDPPHLRPYPAQGIGLSCRELVDGYVALARHDRLASALYAAWQQWWRAEQ